MSVKRRAEHESADLQVELPAESAAAHLDALAKGINDVDVIVQGLLERVPSSKPWQRQVRARLADADRHVEVLRLAISLGRDGPEILEAASKLKQGLQIANVQILGGRADGWTKNALLVAYRSACLVNALLAP